MELEFLLAAALAIFSGAMAVTRFSAVHALLYLIVALLALAVCFALLGAPFAAVLQVIIYAGAITVLFVFVVMMLNLGPASEYREHAWLQPGQWRGPGLLASLLLAEIVYVVLPGSGAEETLQVDAKAVGTVLFGPYLVIVELASLLLLAGLVVAWHVGRGGIGETG
ncbi:MAG: NADH-quinone oxidoreductase subunit J [Thiohalomonadaceae bacterium]